MLTVASILTPEVVTVSPDAPVERALRLLEERGLRHLPVVDKGRLVGIVSERDLMEREQLLPRRGDAERATEVRDRMSVSVETVTPDEPVSAACRRMLERRISSLPVVQDGALAGILSEVDLLKLYVRVARRAGADPAIDPPVEASMTSEVVVVAPGATAAEAFELLRARGIRHLPVVHDGWLVGIVSDRDLLPVVGRAQGELRKIETVMTKDFVGVVPGTPLSEVTQCMLQNGFHSLPVLVKGALRGIVTSADVLQALCGAGEEALEAAAAEEKVRDS